MSASTFVLVVGSLTPLAWIGIQLLLWFARRARWADAPLDWLQKHSLIAALALALALTGALATVPR